MNGSPRSTLMTCTLLVMLAGGLRAELRAQETPPPAPPPTTEQILSYDSDITVNRDSTLLVRETITVFATGARIKHGICRDVATLYSDRFSNPYAIHIEPTSAERDGQPDEFHLEKISRGLAICTGGSGGIARGQHTYELAYTVDRAVGFFSDHDELYWNATGDGWPFPVEHASATVHLPRGIVQEAIMPDAYTGGQGSAGTDFTASADNQSEAIFNTMRVLEPHEALTVVARWPKGFVSPPTDDQKHQYFMEDHQSTLIGLLGLAVVLVYCVAAWFLLGLLGGSRDAEHPSEPPRGYSPATLRSVWRGTFDKKAIVVNLVDLAVKRRLAVLEDVSGGFILGRLKSTPEAAGPGAGIASARSAEITSDEQRLFDGLFAESDTLPVEPGNYDRVGGAVEALYNQLQANLEKTRLMATSRYVLPSLLISMGTVIRCGYAIQGAHYTAILLLALSLLPWSLACLTLGRLAVAAWRHALTDAYHVRSARKRAVTLTAIGAGSVAAFVAGIVALTWAASTDTAVFLALMATINCVFHVLLESPTRAGRSLMTQIEDFRTFLTSAETDPRAARTATKITPPTFEKYLPYAMALNVEKAWSEKFAAGLTSTPGATADYAPAWYSGPAWDRVTASSFATSLGNTFSSAIAAATSASASRKR